MKNSILLPALFLFILLILLTALTALHLLQQSSATAQGGAVSLLERLPRSVETMLPAACVGALLLLFLRMAFRPGNRLLSFLLLFAAAFAVLALSEIGLGRIGISRTAEGGDGDTPGITGTIEERRIHPTGGGALYVGEVARVDAGGGIGADRLRKLVYVRPRSQADGRAPEEVSGDQALVYVADARARLTLGGSIAVDLSPAVRAGVTLPAAGAAQSVFEPAPSLLQFVRDYSVLLGDITSLRADRPAQYLLLCASLIAFVLGASVWMRITIWPLFNFLAALLVVRGGLYLYSLARVDLAEELGGFFSGTSYVRALPAVALLVLGVLFLLIDILFVPPDRFGRRMG